MSLLRLPPEILRQIFDQLDSSFFREDLGRLSVCKKWFDFALPACFKCITLSQKTLRHLIISTATQKPLSLESNLETLDLHLRGYEYNTSPPYPQNAQESNLRPPALRIRVSYWIKRRRTLNNDLDKLAIIAQQSRRLRTLRVRAWKSPWGHPLSPRDRYLSLSPMLALLSVESLSVLVLDLSGVSLNSSGQQEDERHICPSVAALLPTLRILHLRMRDICPDVLKTQSLDSKLRLSTVVINLSLPPDQPSMTAAAHTKPCDSQRGGFIQLRADIREQAEALLTRMAFPQTMRILTHTLPQFDTQSLDVLTGKTMKLKDDAAWDEDGETVQEDSEPESEILDEDFNGFLDD
ncbi:hypothetical protein FGADI_10172 [Fusarium gaditjirri]|uniref:F-box domain-containing protein n=1 Tax=Fusarium gaditjirri TaxID=282569 RepID=A0A8H4WR52_9HYPO|nr:hypothetical protein FGADI_10172 [Fusarium gaditjirri]